MSTRYFRPASRRRQSFSLPFCSQPSTKVPRPRNTLSSFTGKPTALRLAMVAACRCSPRLDTYSTVTPRAAAACANATTPGNGCAFFSATQASQVMWSNSLPLATSRAW